MRRDVKIGSFLRHALILSLLILQAPHHIIVELLALSDLAHHFGLAEAPVADLVLRKLLKLHHLNDLGELLGDHGVIDLLALLNQVLKLVLILLLILMLCIRGYQSGNSMWWMLIFVETLRGANWPCLLLFVALFLEPV